VIGGSAGALDALFALLSCLPRGFPLALVVVVHLPKNRPSDLCSILANRCRLQVSEATDKQPLLSGTIYVAPPDYHLLIDVGPSLALSVDAPVNLSRPSIDVLFESAADVLGPEALGIVLSGANADGAHGLRAILDAGGHAWVQSPREATSAVMPRSAIALCPDALVLDLGELCRRLRDAGLDSSFSRTGGA
jgi:two-component system chemotaxis response regulator CheB